MRTKHIEKESIFCQECKTRLNSLTEICHNCNSNKKLMTIELEDIFEFKLYDSLSGKIKNDNLPSKAKIRMKFFDGHDLSVDGDLAYKKQIIDRDADYYFEEVKNSMGETIHFCEEPLSKHQNRGSAKKR